MQGTTSILVVDLFQNKCVGTATLCTMPRRVGHYVCISLLLHLTVVVGAIGISGDSAPAREGKMLNFNLSNATSHIEIDVHGKLLTAKKHAHVEHWLEIARQHTKKGDAHKAFHAVTLAHMGASPRAKGKIYRNRRQDEGNSNPILGESLTQLMAAYPSTGNNIFDFVRGFMIGALTSILNVRQAPFIVTSFCESITGNCSCRTAL